MWLVRGQEAIISQGKVPPAWHLPSAVSSGFQKGTIISSLKDISQTPGVLMGKEGTLGRGDTGKRAGSALTRRAFFN